MIEDTVRRFISEEVANDGVAVEIDDDYPLLERQVLDSLGLFQLVGFLEEEYGIEVQDEELVPANFATVSDITRFVRASLDGAGA
jgi:acyl carrier protein